MATTVQGLAPGPSDVAPAGPAPAPTPRPGATRAAPPPSAPAAGTRADHLLLVLMALVWGVNFSVLKVGTRYVDPATFNGARVLLATAVLGAIAAVRRAPLPQRADAVRLVLLGVLGHGVYQLLFIEGLARTASGTTALILAAGPAFVGVVGRLLGVERPTARAWGGIALQVAGMAGVVLGSTAAADARGTIALAGVLLVLGASLAWSVYAVLLKPLTRRVDGVQMAAWTLVGGALTLGASAVPALARGALAALPAEGWAAMLYSGVLALALAYLVYYRGVRTVGPVRTAMYSNLQPVVALGVGFVVLGERPGGWQIAGAALIGAGLLASRR
ncbi:membrane protein [Gemmatimonadetes bacterium T265]|nr:membrane protein [Gemmatimonadetes bacterium T265]